VRRRGVARAFERVDARNARHDEARRRDRARKATSSGRWEATLALLAAERVALNFAQRMSGIATLARAFVELSPRDRARSSPTRARRRLGSARSERYAVRTGGARNHRNDLTSAVLIKDNHIAAAGGIERAIERARSGAPTRAASKSKVQSLDELERALAAKADIVLLDNFALAELKEAVRRTKGRAILEASGGVSLDTVAEIATTGVDVISVGALTHSAPAADIALDLEVA